MDHERKLPDFFRAVGEDARELITPFCEAGCASKDVDWTLRLCRILFRYGHWWAIYRIAHSNPHPEVFNAMEKWRAILAFLEENPHRAYPALWKGRKNPELLP